jgi:FMN phosphatase YigB (HAD superfamily)
MTPEVSDTVFLFDVDNTLLDNDRFQEDLRDHILETHGKEANERYWAHFEDIRKSVGYADYIGALERYRAENLHNPRLLLLSNWLLDYPFAHLLYPDALKVVEHVRRWGPAVILSDGDAVFQPRKIERSGLWRAFEDRILIYVHKEVELRDVEKWHPAKRYVLVDDKLRILDAVKKLWGSKVFTVFPKQGHYAHDPAVLTTFQPADLAIEKIGDLLSVDPATWTRG